PRLGALVAADHTVLGQLVDDPAGARVADVELPLDQAHRGAALGGDRPGRLREEWVQLALLATFAKAGVNRLVEDLLHEATLALGLPPTHDRVNLAVGDEGALDPGRLAGVDRLVEHVPPAEQLFGAAGVEDHPAVDLGADREGDPGRDVRLDEAGDDVGARSLGGHDQVDADRPRQLSDPADQLLHLAGRDHHQVGQLVDHYHDVGQRLRLDGGRLLVVALDVADAGAAQELVAAVHLG